NLTPIVTNNAELGIEHTTETTSLQLSYYTSESDFGQRLQLNGDGIYTVQREQMDIDGIELRLRWQASSDDTLDLRYAHTDGQYDSDDDGSADTDLAGANATPDRINLSWERSWTDRVSSRLQVNHLLDRTFRDATGASSSEFDGYTTLDLSSDVQVGNGIVQIGAQNLTNEDYFTYFSQTIGNNDRNFKGHGRTIRLSYRIEF
ncbi:MAG: TonB-dependent receptor, partial [Woeseia sp.]